jgi:hypothetical protein
MSFSRCFRFASVAASFVLALALVPRTASAQQVTYYDFDEPQSTPGQVNTLCTASTIGNALFCFNDFYQDGLSPSLLSDTYPAIIDPNNADNPPVQSTHYAVQMTPAAQTQASSQWFAIPQKVSSGFTTYFTFKFTPNANSYATADGIAFVVQNSQGGGAVGTCTATGAGPSITGGLGGCMGYGGIDNSLAVEFDTYRNDWDPQDILTSQYNDNHVAIQNCGAGLPNSPDHTGSCLVQLNAGTLPLPAITSQLNGITLADGNIHQVVIIYAGPTEATPNLLQVYIDPPFNPGTHTPSALAVPVLSGIYNLPANLNLQNSAAAGMPASLDSAYVGFTSATGAAFEQHEIMNWTFTPHTTVTQVQPIAQGGAPTVAPFGSYVEATTFPADVPTSSISQVFTSNPISPQLFAQLIANTPFAGSQCQVYDNTGGNCVSISRYCVTTGTTTVVPCPATTANDPITIKSAYDDSIPATSPGYLQGDPFYNQVGTITGDGTTATVVCPGECDVTTGQVITILGAQTNGSPSPFNGTVTVLAADPVNSPSTFTFSSTVTGMATGGYLSSSNVQNVFSSYSPLRIDATTTGKVNHFSDFIVTAITSSQVTLSVTPPTGVTYGQPAVVPVTVSSVNGAPTGSVLLSIDGGSPITQALTPGTSNSTASFTLTGLTAGTHSLSVTYPTSGYWLTNTATTSLVIGQTGSAVTVTSDTPNPATVAAPVTLGFSVTGTGTPTGTYKVTSSIAGDPTCSGTLTSGTGTCLLNFSTPGVRTLTIAYLGDTNFTAASTTVQQTVTGPVATLSANSLNFGTVYLGNIALQSVTLTNTGSYKMTVNTPFLFDVGNGDSQNFIALNLCPGTLGVGKSCTIYVGFIAGPTYNAPQTAILKVMDNAPGNPQQVSLTANVINPVATFSPSPLSFGTDPVGTTVKSSITLKNTGGTTLTLGAFSLKGANAADFSAAPNCPASLAPGASCTLSVSFTPSKTGARSASIVVTNNTQNGSTQVNLTGTGK